MNSIDDLTFDIDSLEIPSSPNNFNNPYSQIEQFCTPDSFTASSNYINILLTSYGYPVPLIIDSTNVEDKCKIVNCIYTLLNDKKKDQLERKEFLETIKNLKRERESLEEELVQTKRNLQQKDKQFKEVTSKLQANEATHKAKIIENNRFKEEISKLKHNVQYIKTQYAHETNKQKQELAKTQARLVKSMGNRFKINVAQMNMNSHFETTANIPAEQDQLIQLRNMYTDLLNKSTEREREARHETEDFRTSLIKIYTGVRRLLETQIQNFDQIQAKDVRNTFEETARFRLPTNCGGKESIKYIQELLDRLKEEWDLQIKNQPKEHLEDELKEKMDHIVLLEKNTENLLKTFEHTTEDFNKKTLIYRKFEEGGFFDTLYPTPEVAYIQSDSEESAEELLEDIDAYKFLALKKRAMRDQRKISESAIELGQERLKLEAERWAFNEMKRELQLQEILNDQTSDQDTPTTQSPTISKQNIPVDNERSRKRFRSFLGAPSLK